MKRIAMLCLCLLLLAGVAHAATGTVQWGASEHATGYRVYVNAAAPVEVKALEYSLGNLEVGTTYKVGVSAFNENGESPKAVIEYTHQEDMVVNIPSRPGKITLLFE